jgi:hypothetical protein
MFPYLKEPTIHESFSIMLMERIENLEKENQLLQQEVKELKQNIQIYDKHHYFKFSTTFYAPYALTIESRVKNYINSIMHQRTVFKPIFLLWNYTVTDIFDMIHESEYININIENRYSIHITAYLFIEVPVSIYEMTNYVNNASIKIDILAGGLYELKQIIKEMLAYQVLLPYLNENDRIEIWTRGGTLEHDTNPIMNNEPFTSSSNYIKCEALQQEYFHMIHTKHWNELLGIYHRF